MKKYLTILTTLVIIFAFNSCASNSESISKNDIQKTEQTEKLIVAMEGLYPPFNWTQQDDSNGAIKVDGTNEYVGGYDVEIAKKIANDMNRELVVKKIIWDGLIPALNSNITDLVIAGMSPTDERKQAIDFSENYYNSDLVMVVRKDGKYANAKNLNDFKDAKVSAQLNTLHYEVINQLKGAKKIDALEDFTALRLALQSGDGFIDAYVSERPEAISACNAIDKFKMIILEDGFKTDEDNTAIAVGIKKGNSILEEVNKAISKISQEERDNIMENAIKNQPAN